MKSANVFGQPRVIATLRSGCTPRPVHKTTVVEDLKKLILMDEVTDSVSAISQTMTRSQSIVSMATLNNGA